MQCWNCGFENIPGLQTCARCTSRLNLDAINVEPPRASRWRPGAVLSRLADRIGGRLERLWRTVVPKSLSHRRQSKMLTLLLTVVPGLGHFYMGRRLAGRILFGSWLLVLLLTALLLGSRWVVWGRAVMVAVHVMAFVSLPIFEFLTREHIGTRLVVSLGLYFCLWHMLYAPVTRLASRLYALLVVPETWVDGDVIARGDALVYQGAWRRPPSYARGDLVVYAIRGGGGQGFQVRAGTGIDRVIGTPGDAVEVREGVLRVNGREPPPDQRPLGSISRFGAMDFTLGPQQYLILPTRIGFDAHGNAGDVNRALQALLAQAAIVPYDSILGRVILRVRPGLRFDRLE